MVLSFHIYNVYLSQICLCQGEVSLAEGWVPLKLLSIQDTVESKVKMKFLEASHSGACMHVCVCILPICAYMYTSISTHT